MELMDVLESVAGSGHAQETALGQCLEADSVLQLGACWRTVLGLAVLQKGRGEKQLSGSELQAESELQAAQGTGAGAGVGPGAEAGAGAEAALKAERFVAGLLQDSHLQTDLVAEV